MHPAGPDDDRASGVEVAAQRLPTDDLPVDAAELLGPPGHLEDAGAHGLLPLPLLGQEQEAGPLLHDLRVLPGGHQEQITGRARTDQRPKGPPDILW